MKMSESTYKVELARQTDLLHQAVEKILNDEAEKFDTRMLNAVMGALIASLAECFASVGDPRTRKALRKLMDAELSRQIAKLMVAGRPNSRTMIVDGGLH